MGLWLFDDKRLDLRLTVNFIPLRLTEVLKINFHRFKKLKINSELKQLFSCQNVRQLAVRHFDNHFQHLSVCLGIKTHKRQDMSKS